MAAIIEKTLRPHVKRFGGELAAHDTGLRALSSSLVPDPHASDDGWCIFEVVQAVAVDPKAFVLAKRCAVSSSFKILQN